MRDDMDFQADEPESRERGRAGGRTADGEGQADGVADAEFSAVDEPLSQDTLAGAAPDASSPTAESASPPADAQRALAELRDKYLRLAAEYENYRKRSARERQEAGPRAQGDLVRGILDSLDDLARVTALDPSTTDSATVIEGVDLVQKKMLKALAAAGLEVVNPRDQAFNPERHEAVSTEPALSPEDDHVVAQVYQPGYVFKGQLLRPARVVVKQWTG